MEMNNLPVVVEQPMPKVALMPHPLSAGIDRKLFYSDFLEGESLEDYFVRFNLTPTIPENFILTINGRQISFDEINNVYPINDDLIVIRASVHGGGGDNKVLRTVITIAILVVSQGASAGAFGQAAFGSAAVGTAVFQAAIVVGGMLLMNALIPLKLPDLDDSEPSSTYSLTGSRNRARLLEPLPIVYGVVRMYADHSTKPYPSSLGEDQILHQAFNFGLSDIELTELKIGDTDLESFLDENGNPVEAEISIGDTGELSSFPSIVNVISGGDLLVVEDTFIEKTTSPGTTEIVIDLSGYLYYSFERNPNDAIFELTIDYKEDSSGTWLSFNDTSVIQFRNDNKDLFRKSYSKIVVEGQYDVRVMVSSTIYLPRIMRTGWDGEVYTSWTEIIVPTTTSDPALFLALSWDFLKSFQPDATDYTGQKRAALIIKASGQLNGTIDSFNAIASASVLVWNGLTWNNEVSSNPAWQYLSFAKGEFNGTRRIYGAGLPDSRIDIEELKVWGQWCDNKGLECNIIFDTKMTVIDILNTIARCGRAVSTWAGGVLGVIYDQADKPVVSVFGMSNIIRNSFSVNYITQNQVDEVIVAYTNPDIGYKRDTVSVLVPGVTNPVNSVTIDMKAITDEVQAGKEANLIAAEQFYRRRIIAWESDLEGLTVQRGDVSILAHDMTKWDYSGRLISGTTTILALDREIPFTPATQHYIGVRYPNGVYEIVDVQLDVGDQNIITLLTPLTSAPDDDTYNDPRDYIWVFSTSDAPGKKIKITGVQPINQDRVKITATDEEEDYYTSEFLGYTHVLNPDFEDNVPTISNLVLTEDLVIVGGDSFSEVTASWDISGEYGGAFIRMGFENYDLKDMGSTTNTKFKFNSKYNIAITVEVAAYNLEGYLGPNSRASETVYLLGLTREPADITSFTITSVETGFLLEWTPVSDADLSEYEIRLGTVWDGATVLATEKAISHLYSNPPVGLNEYMIKAIDTSENESVTEATASHTVTTPDDLIGFLITITDGFITLTWSPSIAGSYPIKNYIVKVGTVWDQGTIKTETMATELIIEDGPIGTKDFMVKAIDIHDNESVTATLQSITTLNPNDVAGFSASLINGLITLSWSATTVTSFPIQNYIVKTGTVWSTAVFMTETLATEFVFEDGLSGTKNYLIKAVDIYGNESATATLESITTNNPNSVSNFDVSVIDGLVTLSWAAVDTTSHQIKHYEIKQGTVWSSATHLTYTLAASITLDEWTLGTKNYLIKAIDIHDNESDSAVFQSILIEAPDLPVIQITYEGVNVRISYIVTKGSFPIDYYEIRRGSAWGDNNIVAEIKSLDFPYAVDYLDETFWVAAYDVHGNVSTIGSSPSNVTPPSVGPSVENPGVDQLSVEVIDNNVLFRWGENLGTLPIKAYEIRRGDSFSSANVLQEINGTFAAFFENVSDTYTYWVVAIDTAGNYGTEKSVAAIVDQPPDYILNVNWLSDWSGTKTNCVIDNNTGALIATVDTTETWTTHFTGNGAPTWTSPQDQIDDGYDYYIEPSQATGSYIQDFDYEDVLPSTLIKIALDKTVIDGALTITPNIKVKKLIGDSWIDKGNVWSAFATEFQYVQIALTFASSGADDITSINAMNVILDSKIKNDMGSGTTNVSGYLDVVWSEGVTFIDIVSIIATPNNSVQITEVVDFTDTPNPTGFRIYLFDSAGSPYEGDFMWTARGY